MGKLRVVLAGGIIALLLVSCNSETYRDNYTFTGEGQQWAAEYVQKATSKFTTNKNDRPDYKTESQYNFRLKYKGKQNDLGDIRLLKYSYKGNAGEGSRSTEGKVRFEDLKLSGYRYGAAFEKEDSVIKVQVEWDGQTEEFELKVPGKQVK